MPWFPIVAILAAGGYFLKEGGDFPGETNKVVKWVVIGGVVYAVYKRTAK